MSEWKCQRQGSWWHDAGSAWGGKRGHLENGGSKYSEDPTAIKWWHDGYYLIQNSGCVEMLFSVIYK